MARQLQKGDEKRGQGLRRVLEDEVHGEVHLVVTGFLQDILKHPAILQTQLLKGHMLAHLEIKHLREVH